MNVTESIRNWVENELAAYPALADVQLAVGGESEDITPPFMAIYETGATPHVTDGVQMYGVTDFEITVEIQTVPADDDNEGTPLDDERDMREAMYNLMADRQGIEWMTDRNGWRVFDIRPVSPFTLSEDGRRVSRMTMDVTACPI